MILRNLSVQQKPSNNAFNNFGGCFDYPTKQKKCTELDTALQNPALWKDHQSLHCVEKEQAQIVHVIQGLDRIAIQLQEIEELCLLAEEAPEEKMVLQEIEKQLEVVTHTISDWEFQQFFKETTDQNFAYLNIQAGAGGIEAQDWTEMLLHMYLKWGERHSFTTEMTEKSLGEVAGLKSVTVHFKGEYAYGWLRTETGIHRLVRLSPFDSNQRRHTSFAAVFVSPEIEETNEIQINPADLEIDTYRASGAGGQHVQKTDSAVRITHRSSGTVVQCQNERSQHRNREQAMRQLRAKLYALKKQEKREAQQLQEASKRKIDFGSQIRSYILDDARVKDLRTGVESRNVNDVFSGNLDPFLKASLEKGL